MGFLEGEETTGEYLSTLILKRLGDLNISFEDCRGQSYDNGAKYEREEERIPWENQINSIEAVR